MKSLHAVKGKLKYPDTELMTPGMARERHDEQGYLTDIWLEGPTEGNRYYMALWRGEDGEAEWIIQLDIAPEEERHWVQGELRRIREGHDRRWFMYNQYGIDQRPGGDSVEITL